ncbi:MAG: hypothetical protein KGI97_04895 [Alphaproteobacteria bacterium]|nr:hypothetical protein [Alphaproteobacteria bacterium]
MKNFVKRELLNDVVTGLLVAAAIAVATPVDAWADLNNAIGTTNTAVLNPAMKVVNLVSYGLGAVLAVTGIAGAKKHADNPGSNPLGPAIGKMLAGAAFLAAPSVISMIGSTGSSALGSQSFTAPPAVNFSVN